MINRVNISIEFNELITEDDIPKVLEYVIEQYKYGMTRITNEGSIRWSDIEIHFLDEDELKQRSEEIESDVFFLNHDLGSYIAVNGYSEKSRYIRGVISKIEKFKNELSKIDDALAEIEELKRITKL